MDKRAAGNNVLIFVVIGVLAYILIFGVPQFGAQPTTEPTPTGSVGICNVEDISLKPQMTRLGVAGTDLSTTANNYYIITDNLGSVDGDATKTVPTNYEMQVMFGENSTQYYTVVQTFNTGCSDPKYVPVKLALADTSLNSFYAENSDGSVNAAANTQAMGANDVYETTATIKAGSDTYFGNPNSNCENIAVVEYDKTYIKQVSGDTARAVPGSFTYKNATYDGANAFLIPKSADGASVTFNIKIESTSSDIAAGNAQPQITLFDCDIDKDEDTLAIIEGVEDEDLNSISLVKQSKYIYLS